MDIEDATDCYYDHLKVRPLELWDYILTDQLIKESLIISPAFQSFCLFLQIFDGPSVYYYSIGTFCGLRIPPPVRSSGSTVTLQFQSDSVVGGKGFLIEWTAMQDSGPPPTIPPGLTKQLIYS